MSSAIAAGLGSGKLSGALVSLASSAASVDLEAEGTLDWVFLGDQTDTNIPWLLGATHPARKAAGPGDLWRGFSWVFETGGWISFTQASARTMTASSASNARGDALSSTLGTGFFSHTSGARILNNGFNLFLPAGLTSRRLKMYTVSFDGETTVSARIFNAYKDDGKDLVETSTVVNQSGAGLSSTQTWFIDFASQVGGMLHVNYKMTSQGGINSNIKVQGFALSYTP